MEATEENLLGGLFDFSRECGPLLVRGFEPELLTRRSAGHTNVYELNFLPLLFGQVARLGQAVR